MILPERNAPDLDDVPADVREQMQFHPVKSADEMLALALEPRPLAMVGVEQALSRIAHLGNASRRHRSANRLACLHLWGCCKRMLRMLRMLAITALAHERRPSRKRRAYSGLSSSERRRSAYDQPRFRIASVYCCMPEGSGSRPRMSR